MAISHAAKRRRHLIDAAAMACHRRQKSPTFNKSTKLAINE